MPANTLAQSVTMTVSEYPASSAPVGQGALQVSFMSNVYLVDTQGLEPQAGMSVTITLPYNPADIPSGDSAADLTLSYFNGTSWVTLTGTVNTANDTITVVTNHFSWWAATLRQNTPTPLPTLIPGGGNSFVIYPNPAKGSQVSLYVPAGAGTGDLEIQIYTLTFRKAQDLKIPHVQPGTAITLDLLDKSGVELSNGLYYFVMKPFNGGRSVVKLLVTR
jgi:hypothetical protein